MKKARKIQAAIVATILGGCGFWILHYVNGNGPDVTQDVPSYSAGPFTVQVGLESERPRIGNNRVTFRLLDKQNEPVADAGIQAFAEMPAMGAMPAMRAPVEITAEQPGVYTGEFDIAMDGAWPLTVSIESATLGSAELSLDMSTSRAGLRLPAGSAIQSGSVITATSSATATQPGTIFVDARRRQSIGVTTGQAELGELTITIRAAGQVEFDETGFTDVSLKFGGWVGTLDADSLGTLVRKGQRLFTVYSPALVSTQQEYLDTLHWRRDRNDSLLEAARKRLSRWDIGEAQISELEKRGTVEEYLSIVSPASGAVVEKHIVAGSAFKAGTTLLRIADLSNVWVTGQVYEYELPLVRVGMAAEIVLPDLPGTTFHGTVAYIYPYLEGNTRTARIRVELQNSGQVLRPDMYAQMRLEINVGQRLMIPESAVLFAGESRVVFIDLGDGRLQPRKIKTGLRNSNFIEVTNGLDAGDVVVTSGNFLIAAESKLKAGIDQW